MKGNFRNAIWFSAPALGLALRSGAGAAWLTLASTDDAICIDTGKCRKGSRASHVNTGTRRTDGAGNSGFFAAFAGINTNASPVSPHIRGFMLTKHGVFDDSDANGCVATGSLDTYAVYCPPCDGLPQGDD